MIETSLRAGADVALHPLAAQVEPAVADPQRLVDALLVELERQRRRARDDLELVGLDLDLAGRHRRVDGLRRAARRPCRARGSRTRCAAPCATSAAAGGVLGVDHDLHAGPPRRAGRRRRARRGRGASRPSRRAVTVRPSSLGTQACCREGRARLHRLSVAASVVEREHDCSSLARRRAPRMPSARAITTRRAHRSGRAWVSCPLSERPA